MKHFIGFIMVLLVLSINGCTPTGSTSEKAIGENPRLVKLWETPTGLSVPESVMYDPNAEILYVSNISGKPTLKNGKGFISKVNLDGSIHTLFWVTGLNAPKGMGISGNTLYVTDIDRIIAIDIPTGSMRKAWGVAGAKFLNDIAVHRSGRVYITDMVTKAIHVIDSGRLTTFLTLDYNKPNGLFVAGDTLWAGTAEGIIKIDTFTGTYAMALEHAGGIDGIKPLGDSRYIVSDWKGKIQIIGKDRAPVVLSDTSAEKINAADFEYIPSTHLVIVPTFFDNRVAAYQLE
jgi:DNA-binding beta-propeller fold protein YncE